LYNNSLINEAQNTYIKRIYHKSNEEKP
jgi:hypothetical protein